MSIEKNFSLEQIGADGLKWRLKKSYYFYRKCAHEPQFFVRTKELFAKTGLLDLAQNSIDPRVWERIKNKVVYSISAIQPTFTQNSICVQMYDDTEDDLRWAFEHGAFLLVTDHFIPGLPCMVIENPPLAYAKLCRYYRELRHISVTAVTGSIGKTTLKRMIQAVYESGKETFCNCVNHNALYHAGYFCQHIPKQYEVMVQEVSEDTPHYTSPMSVILKPRVVAITNINVSHIEAFGSKEAIIGEVLSIVDGLEEGGYIVISKDEFLWQDLLKDYNLVTVSCHDAEADYYGTQVEIQSDGIHFAVHCKRDNSITKIHLVNIFGLHNVQLALQAFAAGKIEGLSNESIAQGLRQYRMTGMRQNYFTSQNGIHVYADCFNAVAKSIESALDAVASIPVQGKKVAVLGDVGELGEFSQEEHLEIARIVNKATHISQVVVYGPQLTEAFRKFTFGRALNISYSTDHPSIIETLSAGLKKDDLVVFKGSHSCNLREVINKMWPADYARINQEERAPYDAWFAMINKN